MATGVSRRYFQDSHICDPSVHNESHVGKIQYGVYGTI